MTVGSLFSGIGGFDLAFERAGFNLAWSCEIEAFPRKVLAHHWPNVPCHDDVRTLGGDTPGVDVMVGGFPCQDLSVAGKRVGLSGERSGLFFEFMRVAKTLRPSWVVIENVPGLLSSHRGADFAVVINALVELGYGVAWRILDSQYFGVPQRRRRVFIVGCAGGFSDRAASVLFESESSGRDSQAGQQARARTARGVTDGVGFALRSDPGGTGQAHNTNYIAATLNSGGNDGGFRTEPGKHLVVPIQYVGQLGREKRQNGMGIGEPGAPSYTLECRQPQCVGGNFGIRRLSSLECERLQAFPDGWTCLCGCSPYTTAACKCPDSPRYRALGNAVTVSVVQWIAERIEAIA